MRGFRCGPVVCAIGLACGALAGCEACFVRGIGNLYQPCAANGACLGELICVDNICSLPCTGPGCFQEDAGAENTASGDVALVDTATGDAAAGDAGARDAVTSDHREIPDTTGVDIVSYDTGRDRSSRDVASDLNPADVAADRVLVDLAVDLAPQDTNTNPCGNLELDDGESCDDGNRIDGDGCSDRCKEELGWDCQGAGPGSCQTICGDGRIRGNEFCDSTPFCTIDCQDTRRLAAGYEHTCFVRGDHSVKCWGHNQFGQLGLGDELNRGDNQGQMGADLPMIDLGTGVTAKAVFAGWRHTCALLDDDRVKCWGDNSSGQLGLGDQDYRGLLPEGMGDGLPYVDLGAGRTVLTMAAGAEHNCAVLDNHQVKCWGNNHGGRLGIGDSAYRGDAADEMGGDLPFLDFGADYEVLDLSCGAAHSCAVLTGGALKCWGMGAHGRLGLGDELDRGGELAQMGTNLPEVLTGGGDQRGGRLVSHLLPAERPRGEVLGLQPPRPAGARGFSGSLR